jgi:hypothetical protein
VKFTADVQRARVSPIPSGGAISQSRLAC